MNFKNIEEILAAIAKKPEWEAYRQHKQVLECWQEINDSDITKHTRPLYISRQVLWIATSSSARAQELSFQRYTLLRQLNNRLTFKIRDIRFSVANWKDRPKTVEIERLRINQSSIKKLAIKSQSLAKENFKPDLEKSLDSQAALKQWVQRIKQRSENYSPCPKCAAPTPPDELKRWDLCYLCIANKWSTKY